MQAVKLKDALNSASIRKKIISDMRLGKVFIYPTDTIYGMGCNAENSVSVNKIRLAKSRDTAKHFSVIAPSKKWISSHASVSKANLDLIDKLLPGPYTVILSANNQSPKPVTSKEKSLGVRLPRHPFTELVSESGVPFVTTSVNITGEPPVTNVKDIPKDMVPRIDYVIDAGEISGYPSRIFDMRSDNVSVIKRN